jgi:hypothetical protein
LANKLAKFKIEGTKLLDELVTFLWSNGGSAESDDIVKAFKFRLNSAEEKFAFRAMLREVAELDQQTRLWKLKPKWNN